MPSLTPPEISDSTPVPAGAAFVGDVESRVYYWVGSGEWRNVHPLSRIWFRTESEALEHGYRRASEGFERLEEFEILGEIGRGGTSIVYRARDRALGRDVAIKVIQTHLGADSETLARFAQEARLLAGLRHPNIVSAFSIVRLSGGGLALVMEYVAGPTLRQVLATEGPLSVERAEQVLRDVCGGLAAAHAHGIVHRDVKPDNIFLEESTGRALLADFGIAVHLDNPSGLTIAGTAVGTPNYMSPEQIDGLKLDGRSDLYSLALIGWEMLTGEKPWGNENLYGVIYKQKREHLPPLRSYRNDVPARYALAIEGALAKDPNARWSSVEEFLRHLSGDGGRWRFESRAILWKKRATARVAAASGQIEAAARESLQTVFFRRPDEPEPPATVEGAPDGAVPPPVVSTERRSFVRTLAIGALVFAGLAAVGLIRRDPAAVTDQPQAASPSSDRSSEPLPFPEANPSALAQPPSATDGSLPLAGALGGPDSAQSPPRTVLLIPPDIADGQPDASNGAAAGSRVGADESVEQLAGNPADLVGAGTTGEPGDDPPDARSAGPEPPLASGLAVSVTAEESPGPLVPSGSPPFIPAVRSVDHIAAGGLHTCEIADGDLYCWGGNDRGQLGTARQGRATIPTAVNASSGFQAVAAGGFHTCALSALGSALCWGENRDGQLGDGDPSGTGPVSIPGVRFYSLSLGISHSCGVGRDSSIYCWGSNASGQLGDGTFTSRRSPTRVPLDEPAATVAAGWNHTCALTQRGRVYCWGDNGAGQLGDGSFTPRSSPSLVAADVYFASISAGSAHTCGLTPAGEALCWGENVDGRLGDGTTMSRSRPVRVATNLRFIQISSGGRHTCALSTGGQAYCWGQNNYGQLGTGDTDNRVTPTRVETDLRFTAIRSSGSHTCATTAQGASYCWGYNIEGQIGDGTQTHRTTPQRVARGD